MHTDCSTHTHPEPPLPGAIGSTLSHIKFGEDIKKKKVARQARRLGKLQLIQEGAAAGANGLSTGKALERGGGLGRFISSRRAPTLSVAVFLERLANPACAA